MYLKNRCRRLKIGRSIKKYWCKCCCCLALAFGAIFAALCWKFESDLKHVREMRESRMWEAIAPMMVDELKNDDTWKVADAKDAAIFSAYMDARPEVVLEETFYSNHEYSWALIRIVGILEIGIESSDLVCYYKFGPPNYDNQTDVPVLEHPAIGARPIASSENFGMRYSAAFVLCKLITAEDGRLPTEVTFSSVAGRSAEESRHLNFAKVRYPKQTKREGRFAAACVPSLHHDYSNHENLAEFVEFYRAMGVDHFTFYNTSVSSEVSRLLDYYISENLASVVQWKLPSVYKFERNLRYNGIFAALNDCLYRNSVVGDFTYIINVDLDEFIVPRRHRNFRQLMKYLDPESSNGKVASFIFRNVFFYLMYDDDPSVANETDRQKLTLRTKTTRYDYIYEAYSRSKYIARGENVIEMGNHRVWQTRKSSYVSRIGEKIVDPDVALLHHYRLCEVNELVCWLRETVVDAAARKFTDELGPRVAAVMDKVFGNKESSKS